MLIFNPTEKPVEIRYGGQLYIFAPKESKDLPEYIVKHATRTTNSPLVIQTPDLDKEVRVSDVDYTKMPWKKLVQMASARGIYRFGDNREKLEKAMEDYGQENGTL